MRQLELSSHTTILSVIREVAVVQGDEPALIGETTRFSYRELVDRSDVYGHWAMDRKVEAGEVICLLMPNCPDYVAIWFGLTAVGCLVALINTSLVGEGLAHSIRVTGSRRIIVEASFLAQLGAVTSQFPDGLEIWVHGTTEGEDEAFGLPRIDLGPTPSVLPLPLSRLPSRSDRALLLGTSGTTGLPKSANITHARVLEWSTWFAGMMDVQPEDRLYNCLPLYHSIGGIVAIGSMLSRGGSVVIRTRFSARLFWDDIVETRCTIFQYIGELCRYLTRAPEHPAETAHRLRLCCGNGLRGEVWQGFQDRFRIPRILEFYAATEGYVSLYNCEGKPGSIGRIPAILAHRFPVELIRSDIDTGEPIRDDAGRCLRCVTDEPGEAIGQIGAAGSNPARDFSGYTDPKASERKILRDVFVDGDRWFRTGDLMRRDDAGYFYFIDRIGDTYRWKGENVSTMEVAAIIEACPGITSAVVYGVAMPFTDGRMGMAAVTVGEGFDFNTLRAYLIANLPDYAHPRFVRICHAIPTTGTFRSTKGLLAQAGFTLSPDVGALWFNDQVEARFIACDDRLLSRIQEGALPL